jgi:hypothetical protein
VRFGTRFRALGFELPEEEAEEKVEEPGSLFGSVTSLLGAWTKAVTPDPEKRLKPKDQVKLADLRADWLKKQEDLAEKWRRTGEECEEVTLAPRKTDVTVTHFGLAWAPCWEVAGPGGLVDLRPAYRP